MFGLGPSDPNAVNWGEQWRKIADEIEAEIAERYMELPLDADGVPIHVGDVLTADVFGRIEVEGFVHDAVAFWSYDPQPARLATCPYSLCRHVKPRTIKDVLAEFRFKASCVYDDPNIGGEDRADALSALDEKYATELLELMGGNA
jgi:hypothetical protein